MILSLLGQWCMVLFYVGAYSENGTYEFASLFWCAALNFNFAALFYFTSIILKPEVPFDWLPSNITNQIWIVAFSVGFVTCAVAMILSCRQEDPLWFNYATGAALLLFGLATCAYFIMVLRDAEYIYSQLNKAVHPDKLRTLRCRIKLMRRTLLASLIVGMALNFPFPILHWIQGSVQDMYFIVDAFYICGFLLIHSALGIYTWWDNNHVISHPSPVSSTQVSNALESADI